MDMNDNQLYALLRRLQMSSEQMENYHKLYNMIVDVLKQSPDLSIAKIGRSGSIMQQTQILDSDMDVPMVLNNSATGNNIADIERVVEQVFTPGFPKFVLESFRCLTISTSKISTSKKAVHLDFTQPPCSFDLVPMTDAHFQKERDVLDNYINITRLQRDAAKLVKYAVKSVAPGDVSSYEVVKASMLFSKPSLVEQIESIVKYFTDRLNSVPIYEFLKREVFLAPMPNNVRSMWDWD